VDDDISRFKWIFLQKNFHILDPFPETLIVRVRITEKWGKQPILGKKIRMFGVFRKIRRNFGKSSSNQ
jgi:hypothetical protein